MSDAESVEVRCLICHLWFPAPFMSWDPDSFDIGKFEGTEVRCPHCDGLTSCTKENVRAGKGNAGGPP